MSTTTKLKLTPLERKTSASLALLFAVRMLGLFLLAPVFADAAKSLIDGDAIILLFHTPKESFTGLIILRTYDATRFRTPPANRLIFRKPRK